jgi:hypothetical protein
MEVSKSFRPMLIPISRSSMARLKTTFSSILLGMDIHTMKATTVDMMTRPDLRRKPVDREVLYSKRIIASLQTHTSTRETPHIILEAPALQGKSWTFSAAEARPELATTDEKSNQY